MIKGAPPVKEGDLYMIVTEGGHTFELRYGYYSDQERGGEPYVIYPDFKNNKTYSADGQMLVSAVTIPCEHYTQKYDDEKEDCCSDCEHYPDSQKEIALCGCEHNRKNIRRTKK